MKIQKEIEYAQKKLKEISHDIFQAERNVDKLYAARRELINYLNINKEKQV